MCLNHPLLVHRLRKRRGFLEAAALGIRLNAPHFLLQVQPGVEDPTKVVVGLTASRRVGGAVVRNLAKRRMRVLTQALAHFPGLAGARVVMIAKASLVKAPFPSLEEDATKAYEKAQALVAQKHAGT